MSWTHAWDLKDEDVYHAKRIDEALWQQATRCGISRRRLLQIIAAGGVCTTRLPHGIIFARFFQVTKRLTAAEEV